MASPTHTEPEVSHSTKCLDRIFKQKPSFRAQINAAVRNVLENLLQVSKRDRDLPVAQVARR
jgi:hypothetical protein